jgi:CheY-like chemotaxis protein
VNNQSTIVFVDDNEIDLFLHEKLAGRTGTFSDVHSFVKPSDALDHLASLPPSPHWAPVIVLLDIKMPDMDGFSFLSTFETLPASIRNRVHIVMLTSSLQPGDSLRAEAHPLVAAYLSKPLTVNALKEISETLV